MADDFREEAISRARSAKRTAGRVGTGVCIGLALSAAALWAGGILTPRDLFPGRNEPAVPQVNPAYFVGYPGLEEIEQLAQPHPPGQPSFEGDLFDDEIVTCVYGGLGEGWWGSLRHAPAADSAVRMAEQYARLVGGWVNEETLGCIDEIIYYGANSHWESERQVRSVLERAQEKGAIVSLNLKPTRGDDLSAVVRDVVRRYVDRENIWLSFDFEDFDVDARMFDAAASIYFDRLEELGIKEGHILVYEWARGSGNDMQWLVDDPENIRTSYETGTVIPVFMGYGGSVKIPLTDAMSQRYGSPFTGCMEFVTEYGNAYDTLAPERYVEEAACDVVVRQ